MKKVKILHISSAMSWRGGEQQIVNLIDGLKIVDKEIDQKVYCATNSALENYLKANSIPFNSGEKNSGLSFSFIKSLYELIKSYRPSLIHIHDSHAHTACIVAHRISNCKVPIVLHRRVDFSIGQSFFTRYKYNYPFIKRIITVSKAIKDIISPVTKSKIEVIYSSWRKSSVEKAEKTNLKEELGIHQSTKLIGNIAALTDHKDYPTFIKTASNIINEHDNIHFIMAGEGELKETLQKKINDLGLKEKIHLLGFRKDVVEIMKTLDVFFMPSKMEGLGSILYTAFGCEIPVVSTNAGGIPELVKHKKTGYVANVGDYLSLTRGIFEALEKKENIMVENAYKIALENLYSNMAESTYKVYLDLLNSN
jgi:glycosyltransferase involved in cell wall biosynthesis